MLRFVTKKVRLGYSSFVPYPEQGAGFLRAISRPVFQSLRGLYESMSFHPYRLLSSVVLQEEGMVRLVTRMAALFFPVAICFATAPVVSAQGLEDAEAKVKAMPNDPPRHYNLGLAYFKAGRAADAVASFQKAVELNPNYKEAYFNLGVAQQKNGQMGAAIGSLEKAVQLDPENGEAHAALGGIYRDSKKNSQAEKAYAEALKINPRNASWHYNLGIVYQTQNKFPDAIKSYEEYLRLSPKAKNAKQIQDIVAQMKDPKKAMAKKVDAKKPADKK